MLHSASTQMALDTHQKVRRLHVSFTGSALLGSALLLPSSHLPDVPAMSVAQCESMLINSVHVAC